MRSHVSRSVGLSNEDFINAMGSIAEDASLAGMDAFYSASYRDALRAGTKRGWDKRA